MLAIKPSPAGFTPLLNTLTTMLSSRGQVVIPKVIRDKHKLAKDTVFNVSELPEGILLSPMFKLSTKTKTLDDFIGCLKRDNASDKKMPLKTLCAPVSDYGTGLTGEHEW